MINTTLDPKRPAGIFHLFLLSSKTFPGSIVQIIYSLDGRSSVGTIPVLFVTPFKTSQVHVGTRIV